MVPGWLMPVRSPLTSAMNTGTPILLKFSASVCSVTVLPVPVAPVIRPWRLARPGSRSQVVVAVLGNQQGFGHGGVRGWVKSKMRLAPIYQRAQSAAALKDFPWPDTANGPTSSTARAARTKSAARSGRA
jgi:hypothetical protein